MRSFSSLYFFLRVFPFTVNILSRKMFGSKRFWFARGILFSVIATLIAFIKPYKTTRMNLLDTLLLVNIAIFCHALSETSLTFRHHYRLFILTVLLSPFAAFCILMVLKVLKIVVHRCNFCSTNCKQYPSPC